jgi:hypothetical protein
MDSRAVGGGALAVASLGVAGWQGWRRYTRVARQWVHGHQVLTHYDDRDIVKDSARNVRFAAATWPQLQTYVALEDPAPVLVQQLWDLTLLVGQRAAAREQRQQLTVAGRGVPDGTTTAAELVVRVAALDADLAQLTAQVEQRRTSLHRLASEVETFVTEQQALTRARGAIREFDGRRGGPRRRLTRVRTSPTTPPRCSAPTAT